MQYLYIALFYLLESLFFKLLMALGLSYATYQGLDSLFGVVKQHVISNFMNLDNSLLQILGIMKVDEGITVIFSAYLVKLAINGFTAGAKTTMGFGGKK
ncbi:DUF2523 domain-containing protein [Vibrio campbellii]